MVRAQPLQQLGGQGRTLRKALESAAEELADGQPVSDKSRELLAKPVMPVWLYKLGGTIGWVMKARKNGAQKLLKARPYQNATQG